VLAAKIVLILLTSVTASFGNTLLKAGSNRAGDEPLELRHLPRTLLGPAVLAGAALYCLSQLLWITLLRIEDLSMVYPLMIGLNFTLIMIIAWSYFKEPVSPGKLAGIALIFGGIATVAAG